MSCERDLVRGDRLGQLDLAQRLFQATQRVAQLVAAEHLAQARAIGFARRLAAQVEVERQVALHGGEALDMRASSA